jgi:hypothetical protein
MAQRPEVTGRKPTPTVRGRKPMVFAADDPDAFSISEFCRRHGISIQAFYKYEHEMPVTFRVGSRRLISREAAAAWRAAKEAESAA